MPLTPDPSGQGHRATHGTFSEFVVHRRPGIGTQVWSRAGGRRLDTQSERSPHRDPRRKVRLLPPTSSAGIPITHIASWALVGLCPSHWGALRHTVKSGSFPRNIASAARPRPEPGWGFRVGKVPADGGCPKCPSLSFMEPPFYRQTIFFWQLFFKCRESPFGPGFP